MKKWIHEKTQVVRTANMSERTAKGHGFIPFEEPELKPVPKGEQGEIDAAKSADLSKSPEAEQKEVDKQPEAKAEPKPEAEQPKKKPGRKRTKID